MASKSRKLIEHMFSIELKSANHLKNLSLATNNDEGFLIEGFLGKLTGISFIEHLMLEINGTNGCFRMDLSETELNALFPKKTPPVHKKQI